MVQSNSLAITTRSISRESSAAFRSTVLRSSAASRTFADFDGLKIFCAVLL